MGQPVPSTQSMLDLINPVGNKYVLTEKDKQTLRDNITKHWPTVAYHKLLVCKIADFKEELRKHTLKGSSPEPQQQLNKKVQRVVTEYSLPATVQSHEIVAPLGRTDLLLLSQQESNSIIKIKLNPVDGSLISATKSLVRDRRYDGLHGLHASTIDPGQVWLTLQFSDELLRINSDSLKVEAQLELPAPLKGPHAVVEDGRYLWVACKHSGHIARLNRMSPRDNLLFFQCSDRPNMVARTETHIYASLDQSSRIFCLERSGKKPREIHIPANRGGTPVGLISQPDGKSAWFVLLGSPGTFGCIEGEKMSYYKLTSAMASTAGLIHLAFDQDSSLPASNVKLCLLASSLAKATGGGHNHNGAAPLKEVSAVDALITVVLEPSTMSCSCGPGCKCDPCDCANPMRIVSEEMVMLPTQPSLAHRVLSHATGSVFVTELGVSALVRITGDVLLGKNDKRTDNYALWGHGVGSDHVDYVASK